MIEPNRLTVPGETAARARVETLFERIDEIGGAIRLLPVPRLDLETRVILLADLEDLADRCGRGALLDEARQRVRDGLPFLTGEHIQPPWMGRAIVGGGTTEDLVARELAIEDAVSVAVVADLLDQETMATLASPGLRMLGMPLPPTVDTADDGLERGGADDAAPVGGATRATDHEAHAAADAVAEAETEADAVAEAEDAAAEAEDAAAEAEAQAALRQRRAVLFVAVLAIAIPIAVSGTIGWAGILLIVLAALFLVWLFA